MATWAILAAVVPGLLWLWVFWRADVHEPEPRPLVLAVFLVGAAAVLPAWLVERAVRALAPSLALGQAERALPLAAGCFLVFGPVEELCKFLVVRFGVYRHAEFDEPLDGIVYAAAVALGFGSLENVLYVVDFAPHAHHLKWHLLLARSLLALPGHAMFATTWGYALGRHKFDARYRVLPMLALAAALHGVYDFIILYAPARPFIPLLIGALAPLVVRQIRSLAQASPFAPPAEAMTPSAVALRDAAAAARARDGGAT